MSKFSRVTALPYGICGCIQFFKVFYLLSYVNIPSSVQFWGLQKGPIVILVVIAVDDSSAVSFAMRIIPFHMVSHFRSLASAFTTDLVHQLRVFMGLFGVVPW